MRQRIIKVGNSIAVTIPKKVAEEKNLKVGDIAEVEISSVFSTDQEIHSLTKKLIEKYRGALEELSKK